MRVFNPEIGKMLINNNYFLFSRDCCLKLFSLVPLWLAGTMQQFQNFTNVFLAFLSHFSWKSEVSESPAGCLNPEQIRVKKGGRGEKKDLLA